MQSITSILPVPAEGLALTSLVIEGNGKDLDMRLCRDGRPTVEIPLGGVSVTAASDVVLHALRLDDVSLSLTYAAPRLLLTAARASWGYDWYPAGLDEEFRTLLDDAAGSRRYLSCCVHMEISLAAL